MKRSFKPLVVLAALAPLVAAGQARADDNTSGVPIPAVPKFDSGNPQNYGKQLAYYMDQRDSGWRDYYAKATMTLTDARSDSVNRDVVFKILEGGKGNRTIVLFQTPADIRGVAALVHEHPGSTDDTWLYLPASRRTRRISGANRTASFQGTEFTYEDLSQTVVENYTWKFLETSTTGGAPVFKLEAKPNYKDTGYSKLVVYLNKDQWRIEKIEFYDKGSRLLKTLTFGKWKNYHGRFWRPLVYMMVNHQTRKTTKIEASSVFLNLSLYKRKDGSKRPNLTEEQFTKRALETNQ